MQRRRWWVTAMFCVGCGAGPAAAPQQSAEQSAGAGGEQASSPADRTSAATASGAELAELSERVLRWIDDLGFPSLHGRTFVRVHTGRWTVQGGKRTEQTRLGFLIEERPDRFTVVHGVSPEQYEPSARWAGPPVHFESADLEETVDRAITRARADAHQTDRDRQHYGQRDAMSPRLRAVLLARGAIANGLAEKGRLLLALAVQLRGHSKPLGAPDDPVAGIRGDLGLLLLGRAIEACADDTVSRPELLERFQFITKHFPQTEASALAKGYAGVLEQMIEEDRQHAERGPAGTDTDTQLAEAVYQLRNHDAYRGPQQQLRNLGIDAVPTLIELLDDRRLTRGLRSGGVFLRDVMRYGDVARSALHAIAGKHFHSREQAREWWQEVQRHGEAEVLARGVREGGYGAVSQLRRLVEVDQARAVREGIDAARAAHDNLRAQYVQILAGTDVDDSKLVPFLLEQVRTGPLQARVHAAQGLHARDDERWLEPVATELRRRLEGQATARDDEGAPRGPQQAERYAVSSLLALLVQHGGETGYQTLRQIQPNLRPEDRQYIVAILARINITDPDAAARLDELLVDALDDDSLVFGYGLGAMAECGFMTVADAAAQVLAQRLGEQFDCTVPPYERARRRVQLGNRWRRANGRRPEPRPELPSAPRPERSALDAARVALTRASNGTQVRSALERYERLGLAGSRPLQKAAQALPGGHSAHEPASRLAARLASTVRSVVVDDDAVPLPQRDRLRALKGRPMRSEDLLSVIVGAVRDRDDGELLIELHRDGSGRGVELQVKLRPIPEPQRFVRIQSSYAVRRGRERIGHGSDHLDLVESLGMGGWESLAEHLDAILEAPPDIDGEAQIRLRWNR